MIEIAKSSIYVFVLSGKYVYIPVRLQNYGYEVFSLKIYDIWIINHT
jgi:hypothetical protein